MAIPEVLSSSYVNDSPLFFHQLERGHGGRVLTLSPPTSEIGVRILARPQVDKLVVAWQFTVQNLGQLYVLVSSSYKNYQSCSDLYNMLKGTLKPKQVNKFTN